MGDPKMSFPVQKPEEKQSDERESREISANFVRKLLIDLGLEGGEALSIKLKNGEEIKGIYPITGGGIYNDSRQESYLSFSVIPKKEEGYGIYNKSVEIYTKDIDAIEKIDKEELKK